MFAKWPCRFDRPNWPGYRGVVRVGNQWPRDDRLPNARHWRASVSNQSGVVLGVAFVGLETPIPEKDCPSYRTSTCSRDARTPLFCENAKNDESFRLIRLVE